MTKDQLLQRLRTVYERELSEVMKGTSIVSFNEESGYMPSYQTFEYALKLYSEIEQNKELRWYFIEFVQDDLLTSQESFGKSKNEYVSTSRLSLFILSHLKQKDEAVELIKKRAASKTPFVLIALSLDTFVKVFKYRLNHDQWYILEESLKVHVRSPHNSHIIEQALEKIKEWKFTEFENEIEGINIEINRDKERVIHWLNQYKFTPELGRFLNNLDNYLHSDDENIAAGMINDFRNFMSGIVESITAMIMKIENKPLPKVKDAEGNTRTDIGKCRVYIKEKLELTDHDDELLDAFVNILHKEGGHSMLSTKEYLRLTRNIGIEIVLFLLTRYREKFS